MEQYQKGKEYFCFKCGKKHGLPKYDKEMDRLEMICECGYVQLFKPIEETAITEVVEYPDKKILLG